jgi:hypothetical protein
MTYRQRREALRLARAVRDADRTSDVEARVRLIEALRTPAHDYALPDGSTTVAPARAVDAWLAAVSRPRKPRVAVASVPLPVRVSPAAAAIARERGGAWVSGVIEREGSVPAVSAKG